jgi:hypothetical protein
MRLKRRSSLLAFFDSVQLEMANVSQRRKGTARRWTHERSSEVVDTILAPATRVCARDGYARTTTNRIAHAPGGGEVVPDDRSPMCLFRISTALI